MLDGKGSGGFMMKINIKIKPRKKDISEVKEGDKVRCIVAHYGGFGNCMENWRYEYGQTYIVTEYELSKYGKRSPLIFTKSPHSRGHFSENSEYFEIIDE